MTDPTTPSVNLFQSQSDANHQKLFDAAENAKEEKRVSDWSANHKLKLAKETEQKSEELGHNDVKIKRHKDGEERYPNDEKIDQLSEDKKGEGYERRVKRADTDYLDFLEKDMVECRRMYASIEYNDRVRLNEARRGLQSRNDGETVSTRDTRDQYEKALTRFKDAKIADLKERATNGVAGKKISKEELEAEMRELVQMFGYKEAFDLSQARSETKAETLMGRDIAKKCWGYLEKAANTYNKLPLWSKFGLSAATVALGASLATGAAAAAGMAGVAGFVVGAKRVLGGVVAGVGSAKLLDAGHQVIVKRTANKDAEKLLLEIEKDGSGDKFEKLSTLLDLKIADIDAQLKTQKRAAIANKFIGLGVGVFLGGGYASKAFGAGIGKVGEHFGHGKHAAGVVGGTAKGMLTDTNLKTPITDTFEHSRGASVAPTETIEIHAPTVDAHGHVRHDGFIRSIKDHIRAANPGMSDTESTHIAELSFHDAATKYATDHHISYDKAMEKLGKIQIGTTYEATWDEHGVPKIKIDDDHIKFVKSVAHGHHSTGGHGVIDHPAPSVAHAGEVVNSVDSQWNAEAIENQQGEVNALKEQYGKVLNNMDEVGILSGEYVNADIYRKALEDATNSLADITKNPDGSSSRILRNILKTFSDKNLSEWNRIEKIEAIKLLNPEGSPELGSLSQEARAAMNSYGKLVPPKKGELMGRWVVRFMRAAKDGLIK